MSIYWYTIQYLSLAKRAGLEQLKLQNTDLRSNTVLLADGMTCQCPGRQALLCPRIGLSAKGSSYMPLPNKAVAAAAAIEVLKSAWLTCCFSEGPS